MFFLYFSSIIHLNGKLFISCMLYLLYPSVIEFIFFIVNKQTTSIPRTFEKLATPLDMTIIYSNETVKCSSSDSPSSSGDVVHVFMSSFSETADAENTASSTRSSMYVCVQ